QRDWDDAVAKPGAKFVVDPCVEPLPPSPLCQPRDAKAQLGKCHDAEKDAVFFSFGQPPHHTGVGARLHPFRDDIGVKEEAHTSVSRSLPLMRVIFSREPRSGDTAKKWARLPFCPAAVD